MGHYEQLRDYPDLWFKKLVEIDVWHYDKVDGTDTQKNTIGKGNNKKRTYEQSSRPTSTTTTSTAATRTNERLP